MRNNRKQRKANIFVQLQIALSLINHARQQQQEINSISIVNKSHKQLSTKANNADGGLASCEMLNAKTHNAYELAERMNE
ncbi:unnamed protein product [Ceratitis capitata]|uniref:(Mediterranean fruit fly) hypothetical protein n=1 Tax=Ceratitis capitata TaxID=7213 RepID=A0A811UYN2_CERCA|nr:unnamed protein product [Ceratitis capitata]